MACRGWQEEMEHNGIGLHTTMAATELKHGVLSMTFLRHACGTVKQQKEFGCGQDQTSDSEGTRNYTSLDILFIPTEVRWALNGKQSMVITIGWLIEDAKVRIQHGSHALRSSKAATIFPLLKNCESVS